MIAQLAAVRCCAVEIWSHAFRLVRENEIEPSADFVPEGVTHLLKVICITSFVCTDWHDVPVACTVFHRESDGRSTCAQSFA